MYNYQKNQLRQKRKRKNVKLKIIDIDKLSEKVAELLIDSDFESDHAYNWGLMHTQFLVNGADPQDIISMRMNNALRAESL